MPRHQDQHAIMSPRQTPTKRKRRHTPCSQETTCLEVRHFRLVFFFSPSHLLFGGSIEEIHRPKIIHFNRIHTLWQWLAMCSVIHLDSTKKPGPGAHSPEKVTATKQKRPAYSLGVKHSDFLCPLILDAAD